jgi:hypothetical protein
MAGVVARLFFRLLPAMVCRATGSTLVSDVSVISRTKPLQSIMNTVPTLRLPSAVCLASLIESAEALHQPARASGVRSFLDKPRKLFLYMPDGVRQRHRSSTTALNMGDVRANS